MRLCGSIAEALQLGGKDCAVDGILAIGEHGDYPENEKGQQLYPRRHFWEQITGVLSTSPRRSEIPIFTGEAARRPSTLTAFRFMLLSLPCVSMPKRLSAARCPQTSTSPPHGTCFEFQNGAMKPHDHTIMAAATVLFLESPVHLQWNASHSPELLCGASAAGIICACGAM